MRRGRRLSLQDRRLLARGYSRYHIAHGFAKRVFISTLGFQSLQATTQLQADSLLLP